MRAPLVSVAIASYNGERYLREQLETIYAQTWREIEVVVSDDASSDATAEILAHYSRLRGLRFQVNARRLGIVGNFEQAMRLARGEYVALADQDDLWMPDKIATLLAAIGAYTLIYNNPQQVIGMDGRHATAVEFDRIYAFARRHGTGKPVRHLLAENWVVSHSVLFRRQLLERALPIPPHQRFHDAWLALVAATMDGICYLDRALQRYRRHAGSYTFRSSRADPPLERLRRLSGGEFADRFRARAEAESARIGDALRRLELSEPDREFAQSLLAYYRAGLQPQKRAAAFVAGLRIAPYFHTAQRRLDRWKIPLRPLFGGL
jgi:glycosyltransferase involved in cell wall biosynthesis